MLEITPTIRIPLEEFQWSYACSGGPGGQNVNKVASKAVLRWPIRATTSLPADIKGRLLEQEATRVTTEGDFLVVSQRYRDQERNRQDCLEKLRAMLLRAAVPPKLRRPTRPTWGSKLRRLGDKRAQGERKAERRPIRPED